MIRRKTIDKLRLPDDAFVSLKYFLDITVCTFNKVYQQFN